MKDDVVRRYHAAKNKDDAMLPGVPLRDLTHDDWRGYPKWLQQSIDATGFWSAPTPAKTDKPAEKPETAKDDAK